MTLARCLIFLSGLVIPAAAVAQSVAAANGMPQTPWGVPDLQGIWDYRTMTPLERPRDLAGKDVFTAEEAAAYEQAELETRADYDARPTVHAKFWLDYGTKLTTDRRTSLIVSPSDGRVPARTEDAQARAQVRAEKRGRTHSIQDRSITERCVIGFNAGWSCSTTRWCTRCGSFRWMSVTVYQRASASCGANLVVTGTDRRWWSKQPTTPTVRTTWVLATR